VLRVFGRILAARGRSSDLLARYGGEEFVVMLDGATRDEAVVFADEVRRSLGVAVIEGPNGEPLGATVSAGCAGLDREAASLDALVGIADVGLAMAKHAGRNRVVAA
jgi:diguanylate cyclase (GGDEF)-like protein